MVNIMNTNTEIFYLVPKFVNVTNSLCCFSQALTFFRKKKNAVKITVGKSVYSAKLL